MDPFVLNMAALLGAPFANWLVWTTILRRYDEKLPPRLERWSNWTTFVAVAFIMGFLVVHPDILIYVRPR